MVDYPYYHDMFLGTLPKDEFEKMEKMACDVIESYITSLIPSDRVQELDKYDFDLRKHICYEVDYLYAVGGVDLINGKASVLSIKSVETDNFKYKYGNDKVEKIGNIPIHPFCVLYIKKQLDKYGYLNKVVRQCLKYREY